MDDENADEKKAGKGKMVEADFSIPIEHSQVPPSRTDQPNKTVDPTIASEAETGDITVVLDESEVPGINIDVNSPHVTTSEYVIMQTNGVSLDARGEVRSEEDSIEQPNEYSLPQNEAGAKPTLGAGGVHTAQVHENASITTSLDAYIIPGPARATHYSLNDSAAEKDSIGFMPYVNALSKLLCHRNTKTPLAVGVYGEWGAGKTTFMKLLKREVSRLRRMPNSHWEKCSKYWRGKHTIRQVWFDAWKYDVQNDLWIALLQAITTQIESKTPFVVLIWRRLRRLFNWRAFWSLLILIVCIGVLFYFLYLSPIDLQQDVTADADGLKNNWPLLSALIPVVFPSTIAAGIFYWLDIFTPVINLVRRLKTPLGLDIKELMCGKNLPEKIERFEIFEKELGIRLNDYITENGRLIIYIDDLDRCSPEHAIEIIEAVNLFLGTDRCIFVLGMDSDRVMDSIELKYKEICEKYREQDKAGSRRYGQFFLEKIVQIPISVPAMTQEETLKFAQIELTQIPGAETIQETYPSGSPSSGNGNADNNQLDDLDIPISEDTQRTFLTLLPYLKSNPRTIKRFYNLLTFVHFFYIANREDLGSVNDTSLTMWFFLQYTYPNEIEALRHSIKDDMTFDELIIWTDGDLMGIRDFFVQYTSDPAKVDWIMEMWRHISLSRDSWQSSG